MLICPFCRFTLGHNSDLALQQRNVGIDQRNVLARSTGYNAASRQDQFNHEQGSPALNAHGWVIGFPKGASACLEVDSQPAFLRTCLGPPLPISERRWTPLSFVRNALWRPRFEERSLLPRLSMFDFRFPKAECAADRRCSSTCSRTPPSEGQSP